MKAGDNILQNYQAFSKSGLQLIYSDTQQSIYVSAYILVLFNTKMFFKIQILNQNTYLNKNNKAT